MIPQLVENGVGRKWNKMYNPLKAETIEQISQAQAPVRAATLQESLDILDEQIAKIKGWITVYTKARQTKGVVVHQATLARIEMEREQIKAEIYAADMKPQLDEFLERVGTALNLTPATVAENPDDWARLLKAVRS